MLFALRIGDLVPYEDEFDVKAGRSRYRFRISSCVGLCLSQRRGTPYWPLMFSGWR